MLGYEQFGVSPAKLSFNDTDNFNSEGQTITIENREGNDLTVHVSHVPSLTATGYNLQLTSNKTALEANTYKAFTPVQPIGLYSQNNSVATLNFSESTIVVPAGKSVEVRVQVQPPTDTFSEDSHALYGGFISVKSENTEASIPYIGMIGNMKDLPILDRSTKPCPAAPYPFPSIGFETGAILDDDKEGNFNLKFNNQTNTTTGGAYVLARLLTGTPILQIQVIDDKSGEVIGDVPIDATRTWMIRNTLSVTESTTAYSSWMWPGNYISKDITLTGSNGNEDPKYVEDGTYRLKLRALHVYGDRSNNDDWDEWTSPKLIMKTDVIS